jgi:hypothetical protein
MTEAILLARFCPTCFGIGVVALVAAAWNAHRLVRLRLIVLLSLVLGGVAGFLTPFDRMEDQFTRQFWPSRILSQAPRFVDASELSHCTHPSRVRLLIYEDDRICNSCAGVQRRLLPQFTKEFATEVCIHRHSLKELPEGQTFPVLVLLSKKMRLIVIEGLPEYEGFRDLVRQMIAETDPKDEGNGK